MVLCEWLLVIQVFLFGFQWPSPWNADADADTGFFSVAATMDPNLGLFPIASVPWWTANTGVADIAALRSLKRDRMLSLRIEYAL